MTGFDAPANVIARAKEYGIVAPGYVGTFAAIKAEVAAYEHEDVDPDEDGEKALMRYLEGGWHQGRLHDEPAWAQ